MFIFIYICGIYGIFSFNFYYNIINIIFTFYFIISNFFFFTKYRKNKIDEFNESSRLNICYLLYKLKKKQKFILSVKISILYSF